MAAVILLTGTMALSAVAMTPTIITVTDIPAITIPAADITDIPTTAEALAVLMAVVPAAVMVAVEAETAAVGLNRERK